jgi:hypothetical protein
MSNKTIQLNPAFLSSGGGGGGSTTLKREKKIKPLTTLKPNKVKKQLLAKIKEFQNKTEKINKDDEISITFDTDTDTDIEAQTQTEAQTETKQRAKNEFDDSFENEFNKSLNFLSELSKQRKNKPKKNETLKRDKITREVHQQIAIDIPEEMKEQKMVINRPQGARASVSASTSASGAANTVSAANTSAANTVSATGAVATTANTVSGAVSGAVSATVANTIVNQPLQNPPAYSNLKNGTKPTYRQYHNKTQKNYGHETMTKPLIQIDNASANARAPANANAMASASASANTMANTYTPTSLAPTSLAPTNASAPTSTKPKRFKKRITRTLKYSLGKHKNGKVSVLIKNAKTRRKIQTEQALLKQKSISDIKVYLRSKNLLKVGSEVPNDVLRQMYENAILAGDVTNKSKETLIHNFFNDK